MCFSPHRAADPDLPLLGFWRVFVQLGFFSLLKNFVILVILLYYLHHCSVFFGPVCSWYSFVFVFATGPTFYLLHAFFLVLQQNAADLSLLHFLSLLNLGISCSLVVSIVCFPFFCGLFTHRILPTSRVYWWLCSWIPSGLVWCSPYSFSGLQWLSLEFLPLSEDWCTPFLTVRLIHCQEDWLLSWPVISVYFKKIF